MRRSHNNQSAPVTRVITALHPFDRSTIEHFIKMEQVNLQAQKLLGNYDECLLIRHRIADARLYLLALSGNLPS